MTEVGLGSMQALGPKWVAGCGPCRKCPRLKQKGTSDVYSSTHNNPNRNSQWRADGLGYLHLSHLLVEFSAVSSIDTEASGPCCSGNRCRSLGPDRWSGQSGLRWDLFTSLRLLAGFPCFSCCLWDRMVALQFPPSSTFLVRSLSATPSILTDKQSFIIKIFVICFHSKWLTMNWMYTFILYVYVCI